MSNFDLETDIRGAKFSPAVRDFVAGSLAGSAGVIAGHPFDTIKVRLQSQAVTGIRYNGTIDCVVKTVRKEKIFGLYKGMSSPLFGAAFINAIVFSIYGHLLRLQMATVDDKLTLGQIFVAGAGAGLVNSIISCPMELAKIRSQNQGLVATIMRETPSYGTYFVAYEFICQSLTRPGEETRDLGVGRLMLAGGLSGIFGWLSTYPADVVKTRLQAHDWTSSVASKPTVSSSTAGATDARIMPLRSPRFWHCLFDIVRYEGSAALFRGFGATLLRAFPTNAATLVVYTSTLRAMEDQSR